MNLLITGGLGFIGSCFIRSNVQSHHCVCVDKMDYAAQPNAIEFAKYHHNYKLVQCDVSDERFIDIVGCNRPDWIVHFAASSHVDNSIKSPVSLIRNNIISTLNVIEASRLYNVPTILISTDEVYGEGDFTELCPYHPNNPYSASKAGGDMLGGAYFHTFGTKLIITHSCNNFGKWQHSEKFIPTVLRSIKKGVEVPVYGTGQNVRDWIYVEDHCDAISFLMAHGQFGEHYMIGSRQPKSNLELLEAIFELTKSHNPKYKFVTDRLGHDMRYTVDPSKLEGLGWKSRHSFSEALQATVEWYMTK